jgi:hypothetical protein
VMNGSALAVLAICSAAGARKAVGDVAEEVPVVEVAVDPVAACEMDELRARPNGSAFPNIPLEAPILPPSLLTAMLAL